MSGLEGELCKRKVIEIKNENFYLIVGKNFIDATIAHENRPENLELRMIVETLCREATTLLEGM